MTSIDQPTTPNLDLVPYDQAEAHLTLHDDAMSLTVNDQTTKTSMLTRAMPWVGPDYRLTYAQLELNGADWALLEPWTQTTPTTWTAPVMYCGAPKEA